MGVLGDDAEVCRLGRTAPPSALELAEPPPPNFLKNLLVLLRMLDEKLLRLVSLWAVDGRDEREGLPPNELGLGPPEVDGRGGLTGVAGGSGRCVAEVRAGESAGFGGRGT